MPDYSLGFYQKMPDYSLGFLQIIDYQSALVLAGLQPASSQSNAQSREVGVRKPARTKNYHSTVNFRLPHPYDLKLTPLPSVDSVAAGRAPISSSLDLKLILPCGVCEWRGAGRRGVPSADSRSGIPWRRCRAASVSSRLRPGAGSQGA